MKTLIVILNRENTMNKLLLAVTIAIASQSAQAAPTITPLAGWGHGNVTIDKTNREYFVALPNKFNSRVVILMHGAGGQANSMLEDASMRAFVNTLFNAGFGVVLPSSRDINPGNVVLNGVVLKPRWEHEAPGVTNDVLFLDWFIAQKNEFNKNPSNKIKIRKVFIGGGSSGAIMATKYAKLRPLNFDGVLMINGAGADGAWAVNGNVIFSNDYTVSSKTPASFNIATTEDVLLPYENKIAYTDNARAAGVSATDCTVTGGYHQFGSWIDQCMPNLIAWLRR
jgi:poly(3-hydroxybutyrate) depolymerase